MQCSSTGRAKQMYIREQIYRPQETRISQNSQDKTCFGKDAILDMSVSYIAKHRLFKHNGIPRISDLAARSVHHNQIIHGNQSALPVDHNDSCWQHNILDFQGFKKLQLYLSSYNEPELTQSYSMPQFIILLKAKTGIYDLRSGRNYMLEISETTIAQIKWTKRSEFSCFIGWAPKSIAMERWLPDIKINKALK